VDVAICNWDLYGSTLDAIYPGAAGWYLIASARRAMISQLGGPHLKPKFNWGTAGSLIESHLNKRSYTSSSFPNVMVHAARDVDMET